MAGTRTGWAERNARLEHERAVASGERLRLGERPRLAAISDLEEVKERRLYVSAGADIDDVANGQTMRAAVNDLQHRLLLLDPQEDVYGLALERLMTTAEADRVCAFLDCADDDGREGYALHANVAMVPDWDLTKAYGTRVDVYDDFLPDLRRRLGAGEPVGSRAEFLPRATAAALAEQGVEATLLLPLFVGGLLRGFLRLDRCERARLWSEGETQILVSAAGSVSAAIERQLVVTKLVQRSHELAALLTTSRAITSSIDYDIVLREVAGAAAKALGCPESAIWEYSGHSDVATCRVCYRRDGDSPEATESLVGTTFCASQYPGGMRAVRAGVVATQSRSDKDLPIEARERMLERGEMTRFSVPLVYNDEVFGMMVLVETGRERCFTAEEIRMARVIGEQAAAALHNAALHRREEDQHRWLAALAEATRVIGSRLHRVELLQDVAGIATHALLVSSALVYEWSEREQEFILRVGDPGSSSPDSAHMAHSVLEAELAAALRAGDTVVHRRGDQGLSPGAAAGMDEAGEHTVAWIPFRMKDDTLGAMRLGERSRERRFREAELSFARALGEHAAIALNNARLYAQIEDQAMRDGLTGLANHRRFYDRLQEEIERGRRYGTPVALLMLDIDDFKRVNDTYGHLVGDEVLRRIGAVITEELRRGDLAARYGGEEFCVILPNTFATVADGPRGQAVALAERLRRRVSECDIRVEPDQARVSVTVSIGVSSAPGGAGDLDGLVAAADAALYEAKRAGKDTVEVG